MRTGLKGIKVVQYRKDLSVETNLSEIWQILINFIKENNDYYSTAWEEEPWRFYSTLVSECTHVEKKYPDQIKLKQVVTHLLSRRRFNNESFCAAYKDGYLVLMCK